MKALLGRYFLGTLFGVLLMQLGRYQVRPFMVVLMVICGIVVILDVINEKGR